MNDLKSKITDSTAPSKSGLTPEIQARIGHQLRSMYDDIVRQGVPERFADLIRKLDSGANSPKTTTAEDDTPETTITLEADKNGGGI